MGKAHLSLPLLLYRSIYLYCVYTAYVLYIHVVGFLHGPGLHPVFLFALN